MRRILFSFAHAFRGLWVAFRTERNLKIHFTALLSVCLAGLYFSIETWEWIGVLGISALVISLELMNTAIENLCNFVEPKKNDKIKRVKDIAAGSVLFAALVAVILGLIIFLPYLFTQL